MKTWRIVSAGLLAIGCAAVLTASLDGTSVAQNTAPAPAIDADDIGGVVTGPRGPEAGVWVIAETTDLPTKFVRIVVTDDQRPVCRSPIFRKRTTTSGCAATVWSIRRKYRVAPGKIAESHGRRGAEMPRAAAQYYPAGYWFSLLNVPDKSEFPGTGPTGNGIAPNIDAARRSGSRNVKSGRLHGVPSARQQGDARDCQRTLGTFPTSAAAWERRAAVGTGRHADDQRAEQLGRERALAMFADWTDRIAAGEVPPAPPRPQGIERNVVITQWDWADPKAYLHDRGLDRSPQSDAQRQRADLRRARAERRLPAGARSGAAHDQPGAADRARSEHAADAAGDVAAVAVLGQRSRSGRARTTCTIRCSTSRGASGSRRPFAPPDNPEFCKDGLEPSVGEAVPARSGRAAISRCTIRRRRSSRTSARASARTT